MNQHDHGSDRHHPINHNQQNSPAIESIHQDTHLPSTIQRQSPVTHIHTQRMTSTNTSIPSSSYRTKTRVHQRTDSITASDATHRTVEEEKTMMSEESTIRSKKRIKQQSHTYQDDDINMADVSDLSHLNHATVSAHPSANACATGAYLSTHHIQSPIQQCDANSLSVIFSFLRNKEFTSAIRVNHQWHSTGELNTAWPPFNLDSFIQQLEGENYSGAGQRRLMLGFHKELTDALNHPIKKKVNDIILSSSSRLPARLPEFIHLTALNVTLGGAINSTAFTCSMKDRLSVLIISAPWVHVRVFSTLHELSILRVLVTDFPVAPSQLEQLTQLEYLHVRHGAFFQSSSIQSVRLLSVYHNLPHFSLQWSTDEPRYRVNKTDKVYLGRPSDSQHESEIPQPDEDCLVHLTNEWKRVVPDAMEPISVPSARLISFGLSHNYFKSIALLSIDGLVRLSCTTSLVDSIESTCIK